MTQEKQQHERITLRIPQALHEKAKEKAQAQHISLNSFVVRAIERAAKEPAQHDYVEARAPDWRIA